MKNYSVVLSEQAESDFQKYVDYIMYECNAPITALRHYEELFATLNSLKHSSESFPLQTHPTLLRQFGFGVRRINYKKMAIIFTVHDSTVYIHRILAGSMIVD